MYVFVSIAVRTCEPALEGLPELEAALNESQNFGGCVRQMRWKFQELVAAEAASLNGRGGHNAVLVAAYQTGSAPRFCTKFDEDI